MSNHLGDTNKMVGEDVSNEQMTAHATPNEELRRQILSHVVPKNEREWWAARAIERLEFELNAANESFRKLNIHTLNLVDRIRRLEEAGDKIAYWFEAREQRHFDALESWRKAKEAKP